MMIHTPITDISTHSVTESCLTCSIPICGCGRDKTWHEVNNIPVTEGAPGSWDANKHTTTIGPTCFGTITFTGFGQEASKNAPVSEIVEMTKSISDDISCRAVVRRVESIVCGESTISGFRPSDSSVNIISSVNVTLCQ